MNLFSNSLSRNDKSEIKLKAFLKFIYSNNVNKLYLLIFLFLSIVTWISYKWIYPIPYFSYDSYDYLNAAIYNLQPNHHPKGYSIFLSLFKKLPHAGILCVSFQYFFLHCSLLLLFFTVRFFLKTNHWSSTILYIFSFLNPIFIDASNHIMSDVLFTSISIIWFTTLIWISYAPKPTTLFLQAILVSLAFCLRYSALYYPVVSTILIIICKSKWKWKFQYLLIQYLLIGIIIMLTTNSIKALTGIKQYSPFSGWKLANNALYMYSRIEHSSIDKLPSKFHQLDSTVQSYFKSNHENFNLYDKDYTYGCYYIFSTKSPLVTYSFGSEDPVFSYKRYCECAPLYLTYGKYLIEKNPPVFIKHVILPCLLRFLNPHGELYDSLNIKNLLPQSNKEGAQALKWFKISQNIYPKSIFFSELRNTLLKYSSSTFTIINILFIFIITIYLGFLMIGMSDKTGINWIITTLFIWITNLIFSSFSGPSVVRFEIFNIILELTCSFHIIELLISYFNSLKFLAK